MRVYAVKVGLLNSAGDVLRHVPGELARAMVAAGHAEVAHQNGRVRSIRLIATATSFARMIGPPSGNAVGGVRFTRRVRSDDHALMWWEHHPRSTYE